MHPKITLWSKVKAYNQDSPDNSKYTTILEALSKELHGRFRKDKPNNGRKCVLGQCVCKMFDACHGKSTHMYHSQRNDPGQSSSTSYTLDIVINLLGKCKLLVKGNLLSKDEALVYLDQNNTLE